MENFIKKGQLIICILLTLISCKPKGKNISAGELNEPDAKRAETVQCVPADGQVGSVIFDITCSPKVKMDFNRAVALLHSFEYEEAENVFRKIVRQDSLCAMAYWGIAMCKYHPLWAPPSQAELETGSQAIVSARALAHTSERESGYIEAIALFYKDWNNTDHNTRTLSYERAMENVYIRYPQDQEAAIFYALALVASADPADKSYVRQKKAGSILNAVYPGQPAHPGIVHYIIHTYDYPGLAKLALPAARKYAAIAPASAHAQHMPSHIFTRLGLWDESIHSNLISTASAKCYAEINGIKGHWSEELHGMDYLVYAYLQKGDDSLAQLQYNYLDTIQQVFPVDFKAAYAFAAIPARYFLENKMWNDATLMQIRPVSFPWQKFPWQKAIIHFARLMGFVHLDKVDEAGLELKNLVVIHDTLVNEKDTYKANMVAIQILTSRAWILFKEGKKNQALSVIDSAAKKEEATEKHPVTPGEVIPARESMGDMLMEMGKPLQAAAAYREELQTHPNRFNGLYGVAKASEKSGNPAEAKFYYRQLLDMCSANSNRPELAYAKQYLNRR